MSFETGGSRCASTISEWPFQVTDVLDESFMANTAEQEITHSVAVIGMAGRFPGAASVNELWENLKAGRESIRTFTDEELAAAGVPAELIEDPAFVKARGLIDAPEMFDAEFFGISPHEAELMDPQHRLFLETCWHALENAGHAPARIDFPVGVWGGTSTGMANDTYLHHNLGGPNGVREEDVLPSMLGNANDYLTTRVSFKLDLRGPSVNLQTACSTSLMAIVQAFQSLMTYGCDMALAGGVSVSYPQVNGYLHQEGGIGSPDGHCRPFDAHAEGTVFSNGVGVVVLRRLEDAIKDGDTILAVIRGAACNNDGATKMSFAAPSATGQSEVIATALAVADVDPSTVTYVETHGTGTPLGDPIELEGLTRAFRTGTDDTGFCALGSIKSNFGHLDSAAGVSGFIKTVLCLHHRTLVPTVHFTTPNPHIDWKSTPFFVSAETRPWVTDRGPLRAGVSAFGIGGTNAHVVLEEAPTLPAPHRDSSPQLLTFSARSKPALHDMTQGMARHFAEHPGLHLADVAHTLQSGRELFRHRAAVVATSSADARDALLANDRARLTVGESVEGVDSLVFLFPGGGSQHIGMGRDLYETIPAFRDDIDEGLTLLREREGLDLRPVWFAAKDDAAAEEAFHRPSVQLPAIFILEMAMARLLMRWGFAPTALIGHSLGENTAACLAGVLSYRDALGLVALRGRLFDSAAPGGMLSVTASPEQLRPYLTAHLDLATINGPEQCSVSGPRDAIDALAKVLDDAGIDAQPVPIDIAAHSSLVEPLLEPFEAYLRSVELRPPAIPFLSNFTGTWITDAEATDPHYWAKHLRGTVRFADNVAAAFDRGRPLFLEVGPGRFLSSLVKLCNPAAGLQVGATMRHPKDPMSDQEALLGAVGRAWVAGGEIAWDRIRDETPVRRIPLPGYPFQKKRFLIEPSSKAAPRREGDQAAQHAGGTPHSISTPATAPAGASAGASAGVVAGAPPDVLSRVLELQLRTNAAIQSLFTGMVAPQMQPPVQPPVQPSAAQPVLEPSVVSTSAASVANATVQEPSRHAPSAERAPMDTQPAIPAPVEVAAPENADTSAADVAAHAAVNAAVHTDDAVAASAEDHLEKPATEAEAYLFTLWQEVLGMTELSVHDNFFDLGGHSLLAVRTIARIRSERNIEVPLRALFAGTLRTIAAEYFVDSASAPSSPDTPERSGGVLRSVREWMSR